MTPESNRMKMLDAKITEFMETCVYADGKTDYAYIAGFLTSVIARNAALSPTVTDAMIKSLEVGKRT